MLISLNYLLSFWLFFFFFGIRQLLIKTFKLLGVQKHVANFARVCRDARAQSLD